MIKFLNDIRNAEQVLMFLYSLSVWLQVTICIQAILQDFSQEVMQ